MRRRLTRATVGVVALALVLSGLFTLVLVRRTAREETRRDLVTQAEDLAAQVDQVERLVTLARIADVLQVEGISRVTFTRLGRVQGDVPEGIAPADLDPAALARGLTVSGSRGPIVFAAVPIRPPAATARPAARVRPVTAIVLTRRADPGLRRGAGWFALAALSSLVVAAAVADRLARRVTAPLEAAEAVTRHIAAGDLGARVEPGPAADPEVASLARSINAMADSLGRAKGLERQFLLAVSHDLRTPLTSIRGFAEAIAEGAAPDNERAAQVIAAESRRLERLVADLLELAKLDARRFSLEVRPVDVAEVVADTAEGFRPAADEAGLALTVTVPGPGALRTDTDPDRLAQVVANLVENALKFAATAIAVSAGPNDEGGVTVVVEDDGPGIPTDERGRAFDRLHQSSRTPARRVGSGLGLAIVSELVGAMGGQVRAEPGTGGAGTRMVVDLR